MNEEKTKIKMDDGVARFFTRFKGNLFLLTCGRRRRVGDPEGDSS